MRDLEVATVLNAAGTAPVLLICEHASNHIPPHYADLGLDKEELTRHIAYDPGALEVAKGLALRLNAPLVYANISRLVIDLNRNPNDFDAMPEMGEVTPIPGNIALPQSEREARAAAYYVPFHAAVEQARANHRNLKAIISMHSFTPVYKGNSRPWHVGIIHGENQTLAQAMLDDLLAEDGIVGALNVPYSPSDRVYHTLARHTSGTALQSAMIELRNDLINRPNGQEIWAERLARSIKSALHL